MPIFDQGYQHWQGSLSNQGWRWMAIARNGVRSGLQNRWIRYFIMLAWFRALALAGAICIWGMVEQRSTWAVSLLQGFPSLHGVLDNPSSYRVTAWSLCFHYFIHIELFFAMILVLFVGPSLISQDLRFNALPLYFSRPVRRIDYFLGKLGIIGSYLAMVVVVPAIIAWFFGVLFSLDFRVIFDTAPILFGVILYGLIVTLSAGLLMLALSSLTRNSRYVGIMFAGFWILTNVVSGILEGIHLHQHMNYHAQAQMQNQQQMRINEQQRKDNEEEMRDLQDARMPEEERARRREERRLRANHLHLDDGTQFRRNLQAAFRDDWRPVVSYTSNLTRIGDGLLGYYAAEDQFKTLLMGSRAKRQRNQLQGQGWDDEPDTEAQLTSPRWPWYWSGIVLLALGGLSVWILNTRVKSLDRLR